MPFECQVPSHRPCGGLGFHSDAIINVEGFLQRGLSSDPIIFLVRSVWFLFGEKKMWKEHKSYMGRMIRRVVVIIR